MAVTSSGEMFQQYSNDEEEAEEEEEGEEARAFLKSLRRCLGDWGTLMEEASSAAVVAAAAADAAAAVNYELPLGRFLLDYCEVVKESYFAHHVDWSKDCQPCCLTKMLEYLIVNQLIQLVMVPHLDAEIPR
jgi:hypothetical protein